jgi:hypothetical protein
MSYKFKVGDKGKTSNGADYEVVVHDPELAAAHHIYAKIPGWTTLIPYYEDGTQAGKSRNWLIPPPRTVYMNLYKTGYGYWYDSEENARRLADQRVMWVAIPVIISQEV